MIPNAVARNVSTSGLGQSSAFGISWKDQAHLMQILRATLYSDKILAVLREYSSNAWDSHQESGKKDVPIKVTLPTRLEPTLSIRDFGAGLSREEVFQVFTQYGASTKRGSDKSVGMLGIGSKSGFAYSDSFTIISHHGGTKSTYVSVLDKSEMGRIDLLHEESCGDETGVLIQIAIDTKDIEAFVEKAKTLFQYFKPRPEINTEIPKLPKISSELQHGIIFDAHDTNHYTHYGDWIAVMGCVSYRINLDQIQYRIAKFVRQISGALYFDIGAVQVSASRELL